MESTPPFLAPPRWRRAVQVAVGGAAHLPGALLTMVLLRDGLPGLLQPVVPALVLGMGIETWLLAGGTTGSARLALHLVGPAAALLTHLALGTHPADGGLASALVLYLIINLAVAAARQVSEVRLPAGAPAGRRLLADAAVAAEHLMRAVALLALAHLVETGGPDGTWKASAFLGLAVLAQGLGTALLALANRRYLADLLQVLARLREYGEWFLGRTLLTRAIVGGETLAPRRAERAALFLDVRGFTRWSESRGPEEVLAFLSGLYAVAEDAARPWRPLRTKFTADEIFLIFPDAPAAGRAALALRSAVDGYVHPHQLGVGMGLNWGQVVEGLIGSGDRRTYDVVGDTINTAKRVCDVARSGEILITYPFYTAMAGRCEVSPMTSSYLKGKSQAMMLAPLQRVLD